MPENDSTCLIVAKGHQTGTEFSVTFHFIDNDLVERGAIKFNPKAFLKSFQHAFSLASNNIAAEDFEAAFSVDYLKRTLGDYIEGNDAFWTRFYRDLDVATAPMNLLISRVENGEELKEIIVIDQDEARSFFHPNFA